MTIVDGPAPKHLAYLDCIRGYAILMVIVCHLTSVYPELPYPVARQAVNGWYGVQLFFLASTITLLMSWRSQAARGGNDLRAFALRRLFRVAPAFYVAAAFYTWMAPAAEVDAGSILRAVTFIHAWHVGWLTVPGAWTVVPGSWSISVEMTFYLVFPFYAVWATTLRRSVLALVGGVVLGLAANLVLYHHHRGSIGAVPLSNYLFFWFPNQASVFALGGVVYFLLRDDRVRAGLAAWHMPLAVGSIAAFLVLPYVPNGHYIGDTPWLPGGQVAALVLAGLVLACSAMRGWLVNPAAAALGRASFSAYLFHFAVLQVMEAFPALLHTQATGVPAILAYAAGLPVAVLLTYVVAWSSMRLIEQPMIGLGRRLIRALPARAPSHQKATSA